MDWWIKLGLRDRRLEHQLFANGIVAKLVEVFPTKHESYGAIILYRGRDKDPFAELRIHELQTILYLSKELFEFHQEEVAKRAVKYLPEPQDKPPS